MVYECDERLLTPKQSNRGLKRFLVGTSLFLGLLAGSTGLAVFHYKRYEPIYRASPVDYTVRQGDTLEACAAREGLTARHLKNKFVREVVSMNNENIGFLGTGYRLKVGDGSNEHNPYGRIYPNVEIKVLDANKNGKGCE